MKLDSLILSIPELDTIVSSSGHDLALTERSALASETISDCLRSSGLVLTVVGLLAKLLRLVRSLVSELSHRLIECRKTSLLWTFLYL